MARCVHVWLAAEWLAVRTPYFRVKFFFVGGISYPQRGKDRKGKYEVLDLCAKFVSAFVLRQGTQDSRSSFLSFPFLLSCLALSACLPVFSERSMSMSMLANTHASLGLRVRVEGMRRG